LAKSYSDAVNERLFYFGNSGPKCSVDGWYEKVQHSRENYMELHCSDRKGERLEEYKVSARRR
jgi:hypothetical protein